MKEVFFFCSNAGFYHYKNPHLPENDIYVINPLLTFGPLKNGVISVERMSFFYKSFVSSSQKRNKSEKEFKNFWSSIEKTHERALSLLKEKEIRVWDSVNPEALAGCYYICALLEDSNVKIKVIFQRDFDTDCYDYGEVKKIERTLTDEEIHQNAEKWRKLCEENQNFRTVKEGELVSDFPDFRDGLTTVQRSILFVMNEIGLSSQKSHKPSAKIFTAMWDYEPFGDYMVFSQIARLTQKFSVPYPLISGHGFFGTRKIPHAGYNTKIRLSKRGEELLENVHSKKVPFIKVLWGKGVTKPEFLPGNFPNVFCNGNYNLIPHKLENVRKMLDAYARNPDITIDELIDLIGEPFFTDGRIILNPETLPAIYRTGKGILRYKYADSEKVYEDEINYTLLKDGEGVLMNLKELVKNYADYRGRIER